MSSNEVPVTVLSSLEAATTIGKGDVCRFEDIVDIERYPILDLNSSQGKDLLLQCKEEFDRTGSLSLKGFIRENMITKMYEEIKPLITVAHRRLELVNPFGILATDYMDKEVERTGKPLPPDHALKHRLAQDVNAVANDQIPAECMVNVVYKSETFHAFIAAIVDAPKLFIYGDEFQSLNLMYIKDGGSRGWHFDNSDFVVTMMINQPVTGGEFEFVPHMRDKEMIADYSSIKRVLNGEYPTEIRKPQAGTINVFKGNRALHRVRCVYGKEVRTLAVLSYDSVADRVGPPKKNVSLYGERVRKIYQERGVDI